MRRLLPLVLCLCVPSFASAGERYDDVVDSIEKERARWNKKTVPNDARAKLERALIARVHQLAKHWLGTKWGMGLPQTSTPKVGKINCGTFVGTVLEDAGFVVNVRKLQRQPSELIIDSFVGRSRKKRFSNASMTRFVAGVRTMGPGLFIIGLDNHVGFLIQTKDDLRFVHASYVTNTVVDEPAATAVPIVTSKYRVVGKILSPANLDAWSKGRRIKVKGNW